MRFLGIDAGGTATRWAIIETGGAAVARGDIAGFNGHIFQPAARARAETGIAALGEAARAHGPVAGIHAGVTGLPFDAPESAWIRDRLAAACGCAADRIAVEDDISLVYRGCFQPGEGVLVYAGTGSLAMHMTARGERWRAGGHGLLIDDDGSAVWIARQALRRMLERDDAAPGSGWTTALGHCLGARFERADWPAARAFVYGAERGALGQLARAVAEAAEQGDEIAARTLDDAGAALAATAGVLLKRTGPLPVALAGGALRLSPRIARSFRNALPELQTRAVDVDGALVAARLAAGLAPRAEPSAPTAP